VVSNKLKSVPRKNYGWYNYSVVTRSTIQFRKVGNIDENQQQNKQKIR
jgi:hypothetical protein